MPLLGDGLNREAYARVLERLHSIVAAWEAHLPLHPQRPDAALIEERNRLPLLECDLDFLGVKSKVSATCGLPDLSNHAQLMGAIYVMEGSRLGGQFIARHVEKALDFAPGEGTGYFRGFGERTGPMWKDFLNHLTSEIPDSQTEEVIVGAKKMFATFGTWMQGLAA